MATAWRLSGHYSNTRALASAEKLGKAGNGAGDVIGGGARIDGAKP